MASDLIRPATGTIHHLARGVYGTGHLHGRKPMRITHFNLGRENVMADLCLGAIIVGINILIGMGLFIVFT
jgi:hypothetical protein